MTFVLERADYDHTLHRLAGWWTMDRSILTPLEVVLYRPA